MQGDREALSQLLLEHCDALVQFLERKLAAELKRRIEASDLFQETCVAAFQNIRSFEPKSDRAFAQWLNTIAENRLCDLACDLHAQKRGGEFEQAPAEVLGDTGSYLNLLEIVTAQLSTPSLIVSREEGVRELQAQLAALPADYREAISLKDLQGLSVEETAARMNRPLDEVRGLRYRGRKKLAELMGNSSLYQFRR